MCGGAAPLDNPATGRPYDCDEPGQACPKGSYCHITTQAAHCCHDGETLLYLYFEKLFEEKQFVQSLYKKLTTLGISTKYITLCPKEMGKQKGSLKSMFSNISEAGH